jgi:hypothetical protein
MADSAPNPADGIPNPPSPVPGVTPPPVGWVELNQGLDALQQRVERLAQSGGCYADIESQIATARALVVSCRISDAQSAYDKAYAGLRRAETSAHAQPLAWKLLAIEAAYLAAILVLGYLVKRYPAFWLWSSLVGLGAKCAWFGALGGVTIGIYGIYTHISAKDFDPSFTLWYICKPVMGAIFGWFVFLVYYVGVVSAQAGTKPQISSPELSYLIAFLAGFSERFTIKTIDRFMTVLTAGDDKNKDQNKNQPRATPSSVQP